MDTITKNVDLINVTTSESSSVNDIRISTTPGGMLNAINYHNTSIANVSQQFHNESQYVLPIFEGFIVAEILMIALELSLASIAACKISGWRSNYRNQMLMQLSVARFIKRLFIYAEYLTLKEVITSSLALKVTLIYSQIYIDYVISVLVCFFIKHMYESLIIVIVKISRGSFYKVLGWSWLAPILISAIWTSVIVTGLLERWSSYFIVCCIFRWPLMFVSTTIYVVILYKVIRDDIRKYARSLTIVTFLLCLFVNFYLLFKDIIELWCLKSFQTILVSYILGFCLNALVLCLYVALIALNYHSNRKQNIFYANAEPSVTRVIK